MTMIEPADERCLSCGHNIAEHKQDKCHGVYNVYDVHGDETVGCLCRAFDDEESICIPPKSQDEANLLGIAEDITRKCFGDLK